MPELHVKHPPLTLMDADEAAEGQTAQFDLEL